MGWYKRLRDPCVLRRRRFWPKESRVVNAAYLYANHRRPNQLGKRPLRKVESRQILGPQNVIGSTRHYRDQKTS